MRPLLSIRALLPGAVLALCACYGANTAEVEGDFTPRVPDEAPSGLQCEAVAAPPTPTRLLTREEYDNTVRDLLGDTTRPARAFPKEPLVLGFENNASAHKVNALLVRAYLDAAEDIAARAVAERRALLVPCDPVEIGEAACAELFLDTFVPRAYRRPPTPEELSALRDFFDRTRATEGFDTAVEWTVQVVLQSPQFLYRVERGAPEEGPVVPLDSWALASRLSYFLWSSMPDAELFEAARTGDLATPEGIEAQARRMLADPRAEQTVQSFFRQWFRLDGMEVLEKDAAAHPGFSQDVPPAWREGVERFLIEDFWRREPTLKALFTSPALYVNEATAPLYGISTSGPGFLRLDMPPKERAGVLTQPGLLALLAGPQDSSPVRRGVFIRERILCEPLRPPPADLPITPPDPDPNATTRERFAEHTTNATCAACHQLIDPIGFGFENYDALGRFRVTENGLPVDASGEIHGTEDPALKGPFQGAVELAHRLANSRQVQDCVGTQWFRFALGRVEAPEDTCSLARVKARFAASGGDFRELLVEITKSRAFRMRAAPEVP